MHGHPDAGTFWEQRYDESVRSMGFQPVGEEWPCVYAHPELQLVLVVYVDDFKMASPKNNLKKGWELLCEKLIIEPETGLDLYLGFNQCGQLAPHAASVLMKILYGSRIARFDLLRQVNRSPGGQPTMTRNFITWCVTFITPSIGG